MGTGFDSVTQGLEGTEFCILGGASLFARYCSVMSSQHSTARHSEHPLYTYRQCVWYLFSISQDLIYQSALLALTDGIDLQSSRKTSDPAGSFHTAAP